MEMYRFNYDITCVGRVTCGERPISRVTRLPTPCFHRVPSFCGSRSSKFPYSRLQSRSERMIPSMYRERAKMAFDYADTESKGSLNKQQYKIAMTAVFGYRPDKGEAKEVFQSADRISYEGFERWVSKKCVASESVINAETMFALLDKDYKGYLVFDDFHSASKSVDLKVSSAVWQAVFKDLDRYKRGYIDFDALLRVLPTYSEVV